MKSKEVKQHVEKRTFGSIGGDLNLNELLKTSEPYQTVANGKIMVSAWANSLPQSSRSMYARAFIQLVMTAYWIKVHDNDSIRPALPHRKKEFLTVSLDSSVEAVAEAIGAAAGNLDIIDASYHLGSIYTSVLPDATRSKQGVYYTPPSLTKRLIQICEDSGVAWKTARVVDPACGGGAFLAPVCIKVAEALRNRDPEEVLSHVEENIRGFEIDPFAAWLTQIFVEAALRDIIQLAGRRLNRLVTVCNSLDLTLGENEKFDLVIGNPPYGKVKLEQRIRTRYLESLYGHANYYGLFTHLALNLVKKNGTIGYVTPTSFLAGEYFKNLRILLRRSITPVVMDFISFRKGVFEGVLQETMLTVYRHSSKLKGKVRVNQITTQQNGKLIVEPLGLFDLPTNGESPWILPRKPEQTPYVLAMTKMSFTLKDWGYKVSTGPLVWNRHKKQLLKKQTYKSLPIIWSEAISHDGEFTLEPKKINHQPFFANRLKDEWIITRTPCVLLQRTTAKEQGKRLIAAMIPKSVFKRYKGVVVENHLNMLLKINNLPLIDEKTLTCFLNSKAANEAFRAVSGSVAVSAFELENFPLPAVEFLSDLQELISRKENISVLEEECHRLYRMYK
jgi:adenine-specific DNA-methyltransferase